jgi:GNAT superfamily N-acetyltransferase
LFATFVDANYRRKGIGARLIEEAFAVAASHGCSEFEIRLTQPSPEKDALFEWYRRYAKANSHRFKFIIYYWTQMERYGYA